MKKILLLFVLSSFLSVSCKKKDNRTPEEIYSERLDGNWNVMKLDYSATIQIPLVGTFPINGTANNAGSISFNDAAKTANYDIKFLPSLPGLPPGIIDIDTVSLVGTGTYSNTTTTVTLTEAGGQVLIFNVLANEENLQLMNTQVNYQADSATVIPVTLSMTLNRQ